MAARCESRGQNAALVGSLWGVTRVVATHNTGAARVDTGPCWPPRSACRGSRSRPASPCPFALDGRSRDGLSPIGLNLPVLHVMRDTSGLAAANGTTSGEESLLKIGLGPVVLLLEVRASAPSTADADGAEKEVCPNSGRNPLFL